jgi:hypothetical protein
MFAAKSDNVQLAQGLRRGGAVALAHTSRHRRCFTKANVPEVVTIIATKTTSHHTNHMTHKLFESFMADPALNWVG